jgi:hypothetical protein
MILKLKAAFDVMKIFLWNMIRYPGLFWIINVTNISKQDSAALVALVSKAMSDDDVDTAMAILNKYWSDGLGNST